jgi:hypothetical protein
MFLIRIRLVISDSFSNITKKPLRMLENFTESNGSINEMDRNVADFLWMESPLSFGTKDGQYRIQTPTISAFEAEFETCLITIKKGLEPLWSDRRSILKPSDSSGLFKLYSDSMFFIFILAI